ncbi:hypothetical protein Tco_1259155 [Tanacetum coccineum]
MIICEKNIVYIPLGAETLTIQSNMNDGYASIVASEQRAELFGRIGTLERDNMRLKGMLGVESTPNFHISEGMEKLRSYYDVDSGLRYIDAEGEGDRRTFMLSSCAFRMSNLKMYLSNETQVIPLDEIQIDDTFHFIEEPIEIMDREVKRLKQSRIPIVKVRWNSRRGLEFTWECEDQFQKKYPYPFAKSVTTLNVTS